MAKILLARSSRTTRATLYGTAEGGGYGNSGVVFEVCTLTGRAATVLLSGSAPGPYSFSPDPFEHLSRSAYIVRRIEIRFACARRHWSVLPLPLPRHH